MAAKSERGTVGAVHKPKRSRWRSTAAIAAAVTTSTICLREGAEAASEPCTVLGMAKSCTVLDIGARKGRRCVTRGLKILGGNGGVSLSVSAAWNITGGTCRRSRSVLGGAARSRYPSPRRLSVWSSLGRWRVPRGGVGRWGLSCRLSKKILTGWRGSFKIYEGCRGANARREGCHKPRPGGREGGVSRSRLVR